MMSLIKRWLPVAVAFVMGVFFAAQYYIPQKWTDELLSGTAIWFRIISFFAMGLGLVSLFHVHIYKIKRKAPAWGFSIIVFLGLFGMIAAGIISGGVGSSPDGLTIYGWLYKNVQVPLQATMFSILAFYIASAAFKSFRAKTREATLLLIAGLIVMFGRAPMGEWFWQKVVPTFTIAGVTLPPTISQITTWVMTVPNMAAQGGIALGISLGVIAMSLKIIFGIERAYMGGGK